MVVGWKAGLEKQALLLNQKAPVFVVNLKCLQGACSSAASLGGAQPVLHKLHP